MLYLMKTAITLDEAKQLLATEPAGSPLSAAANTVISLHAANEMLESALVAERKAHLATATKALAYAEKTGETIKEMERTIGRVATAAGLGTRS